jgi:hypothetical protein
VHQVSQKIRDFCCCIFVIRRDHAREVRESTQGWRLDA